MTTTNRPPASQELVPAAAPGALAAPLEDPWADLDELELPSDGSENIRIVWPSIKIVSAVSKMPGAEKHGGEFWHTDREDFQETLEVIPLHMAETRSLFGDNRDAPLCMSLDGIAPRPEQPLWAFESFTARGGRVVAVTESRQPALCALCPFSKFGKNNERPLCDGGYMLMVVRQDDDSFASLRLPVSSMGAWKNAVNRYLVTKRGRVPMYAGTWTLGTRQVERDSKKWAELVVTDFTPHTKQKLQELADMVRRMKGAIEQGVREVANETAIDDMVDVTPASSWNDVPARAVNDDELPFE